MVVEDREHRMTGNAKKAASTVVGFVIMAVIFVGSVALALLFIGFLTWIINASIRYLIVATFIGAALDIVIFLPLTFLRWTRAVSYLGFTLSSWVFGLTAFAAGFLTTMEIWGRVGVFIGLFLLGVGVVPIGLLASLLHGAWLDFFTLLGLVVAYFLATFGAAGAQSLAERDGARAPRVKPLSRASATIAKEFE